MQFLFIIILLVTCIASISMLFIMINYPILMKKLKKYNKKQWEYLSYFDKKSQYIGKAIGYFGGRLSARTIKYYFNKKKSENAIINRKKNIIKKSIIVFVISFILIFVFTGILIYVGFKFCE